MIGIDILEIERVFDFVNNTKLQKKIFTQNEIDYFTRYNNPCERIAGMFCAKEAVKKALNCDKDVTFINIEILHKDNGAPYVKLHDKTLKYFEENKYKKIEISISHSKTIATAICKID